MSSISFFGNPEMTQKICYKAGFSEFRTFHFASLPGNGCQVVANNRKVSYSN